MNTLVKCAGWVGVGAVVFDYGYKKHLYSNALKCLWEKQLAVGGHNKYDLIIISKSAEEVVGSISFIYKSNAWSVDSSREDLLPICHYLSYRETPQWYKFTKFLGRNAEGAIDRIRKSAEKLPPTELER